MPLSTSSLSSPSRLLQPVATTPLAPVAGPVRPPSAARMAAPIRLPPISPTLGPAIVHAPGTATATPPLDTTTGGATATMCRTHNWKLAHTLWLLLLTGITGLVEWFLPQPAYLGQAEGRSWAWIATLLLLATSTTVIGHGVTGLLRGLFIDQRNKISLSRFQMALWTIVVLSAFLTAALSNLAGGQSDPLAIAIPQALWLAMGISITSLVGSPLILSAKQDQPADLSQAARTFRLLAASGQTNATASGQIIIKGCPEDARWSDLFQGEETGNGAQVDLGKVQMFYFTLVLVFAYAGAIGYMFAHTTAKITSLPALSTSMAALLGLSHAGYLTNKAIPHSSTGTGG